MSVKRKVSVPEGKREPVAALASMAAGR